MYAWCVVDSLVFEVHALVLGLGASGHTEVWLGVSNVLKVRRGVGQNED
jgi:hypothetical protein